VSADGQPVAHAKVTAYGPDVDRTGAYGETDASGAFELGPLVPGNWAVWVDVDGHPDFTSGWREIGADATWNLGTIWLPAGGIVHVKLHGAEGLEPRLSLANEDFTRFASIPGTDAERRSEPVAAGSCFVCVQGKGVAAAVHPVQVRAGAEITIEVTLQPGFRRRFQLEFPAPLAEIRVRILRGEELVRESFHRARGNVPVTSVFDQWLAPGDYTVRAHGSGHAGETRFTVDEGTAEDVRVVLR
jgi:hypothetical protein